MGAFTSDGGPVKVVEKITNTIRSKNFTITASEGFFRILDKKTDMEVDVDFKDKEELIKLLQRL